ncbi:hypothetical protein AURDEDRAFT_164160 [Auricularia subglabra TFB-10046 SS5]|nr:hypothetical protein AURDEDRAFT_164160 [Auricularia subglabra TFB-10046 SS5]
MASQTTNGLARKALPMKQPASDKTWKMFPWRMIEPCKSWFLRAHLPGSTSGITSFTGGLVILLTVESLFGNLTYYGHDGTPPAPLEIGDLEKRCGSNAVGCDGGNVPDTAPCASLIYGAVQTSSDVLPDWVRSICLNSNGQRCISWGKPTSGLRITTLFKAANTAFASCVASGQSGFTRDTGLNGVCTDQCLSNRPDGCT